jgi:hypothetical protein
MEPKTRRIGRRLWLPAAAFGVAGMFGLADFSQAEVCDKLLLAGPHFGGVVMTAVGGYVHPWAGVIGLCGSALMAGLTWWDKLDRLTEGFEWQFSNVLSGAFCCGANYGVLAVVVCVVSLLGAHAEAHRHQ